MQYLYHGCGSRLSLLAALFATPFLSPGAYGAASESARSPVAPEAAVSAETPARTGTAPGAPGEAGSQAGVGRASPLVGAAAAEGPAAESEAVSATEQKQGTPPVLRGMAQADDAFLRLRALEGWMASGALGAVEHFLDGLTDASAEVRALAAKGLCRWAERAGWEVYVAEAFLEAALRLLTTADDAALAAFDAALPYVKSAAVAARLREVLASDDAGPLPRRAAAYCLGRMGDTEAGPLLAEGAWFPDPDMAFVCAEGLYMLRDPRSAAAWFALLRHESPELRSMAVDALITLGGEDAFDALREVALGRVGLGDPLVAQAVHGLGQQPGGGVVPALIDVMEQNPRFRRLAQQYLNQHTGIDLGDQAPPWREWYAGLAPSGVAPYETGPMGFYPIPEAPPSDVLGEVVFVPPELRGAPGQGLQFPGE